MSDEEVRKIVRNAIEERLDRYRARVEDVAAQGPIAKSGDTAQARDFILRHNELGSLLTELEGAWDR